MFGFSPHLCVGFEFLLDVRACCVASRCVASRRVAMSSSLHRIYIICQSRRASSIHMSSLHRIYITHRPTKQARIFTVFRLLSLLGPCVAGASLRQRVFATGSLTESSKRVVPSPMKWTMQAGRVIRICAPMVLP